LASDSGFTSSILALSATAAMMHRARAGVERISLKYLPASSGESTSMSSVVGA
jgi:hypothetical protein